MEDFFSLHGFRMLLWSPLWSCGLPGAFFHLQLKKYGSNSISSIIGRCEGQKLEKTGETENINDENTSLLSARTCLQGSTVLFKQTHSSDFWLYILYPVCLCRRLKSALLLSGHIFDKRLRIVLQACFKMSVTSRWDVKVSSCVLYRCLIWIKCTRIHEEIWAASDLAVADWEDNESRESNISPGKSPHSLYSQQTTYCICNISFSLKHLK